jgi:hypothetical protein
MVLIDGLGAVKLPPAPPPGARPRFRCASGHELMPLSSISLYGHCLPRSCWPLRGYSSARFRFRGFSACSRRRCLHVCCCGRHSRSASAYRPRRSSLSVHACSRCHGDACAVRCRAESRHSAAARAAAGHVAACAVGPGFVCVAVGARCASRSEQRGGGAARALARRGHGACVAPRCQRAGDAWRRRSAAHAVARPPDADAERCDAARDARRRATGGDADAAVAAHAAEEASRTRGGDAAVAAHAAQKAAGADAGGDRAARRRRAGCAKVAPAPRIIARSREARRAANDAG